MRLENYQKALFMLKRTEGIGNIRANKIIEEVEDLSNIYSDIKKEKPKIIKAVGEKLYNDLANSKKDIDFDWEEKKINVYGTKLLSICDKYYPFLLKQFDQKPLMLYCKGNIELLSTRCFGIVGTRMPTRYGIKVTEDFASVLAKKFTIVSGLASGIDSIAHRITLQNHGYTIAVLGNGVEKVYPQENYELYKEIEKNGLIISEYDIGTMPQQYNFPARNRIISGLCRGILVTEAGEKSGTMTTINHACAQGREVFCVPGSIYNKNSSGCNKAIKECQTILVTDVNDVLLGMGIEKIDELQPTPMKLDILEEKIVVFLEKNGDKHFEEILMEVDLTVPQLNSLLIKMKTKGIINKCKNNYWSIE